MESKSLPCSRLEGVLGGTGIASLILNLGVSS
jgi:hypothetical protein